MVRLIELCGSIEPSNLIQLPSLIELELEPVRMVRSVTSQNRSTHTCFSDIDAELHQDRIGSLRIDLFGLLESLNTLVMTIKDCQYYVYDDKFYFLQKSSSLRAVAGNSWLRFASSHLTGTVSD